MKAFGIKEHQIRQCLLMFPQCFFFFFCIQGAFKQSSLSTGGMLVNAPWSALSAGGQLELVFDTGGLRGVLQLVHIEQLWLNYFSGALCRGVSPNGQGNWLPLKWDADGLCCRPHQHG